MPTRRGVVIGGAAMLCVPPSAFAQAVELVIDVRLPSSRTETGLLTLKRSTGNALVSNLKVLGKSDNANAAAKGNPSRDPTRPYGDTPTGGYAVPRVVATGAGTVFSAHSYGSNGALVLDPVSGDALAAKANGRVGLLIYGGAPGTGSRLRATHGCLRLSDGDMKRLVDSIAQTDHNTTFQRCDVVNVSVLVGEASSEGAGADETDPPPDILNLLIPERPISLP